MSSRDLYNTRRRRHLYGSGPPTRRSTLSYWIPLVLTVTVATAGLVAWIWSERQDNDSESQTPDDDEHNTDIIDYINNDVDASRSESEEGDGVSAVEEEEDGIFARVSGAVRRSTSSQDVFDNAGQRIVAGLPAAGAAMGLARTRDSNNESGFSDHERWSEEVDAKRVDTARNTGGVGKFAVKELQKKRKTVAVVVSAEDVGDDGVGEESILSRLVPHHDLSTTKTFVLIYSPHLASSSASTTQQPPSSTSFSPPVKYTNHLFDTLHTEALALVDHPTSILPFATPTGYIHLLRHLAPSVVYIVDSASISASGANIGLLKGWVGQIVVVTDTASRAAGGGDGGVGGVTRNGERDGEGGAWWEDSTFGSGKGGIEVLEVGDVGEDWERRVTPRS